MPGMGSENKQSLWSFACGVYDFSDVKVQCLELQDIYAANVDVILWLCWLHSGNIGVSKAALSQALDIVGGVNQDLLEGLRDLRNQLLASSSFTRVQEQLVRKHMLAAELAIEKVLLQRLQDLTARQPLVAEDEEPLSLFDYLDSLGNDRAGAIAADLLASSRGYCLSLSDECEDAVESST